MSVNVKICQLTRKYTNTRTHANVGLVTVLDAFNLCPECKAKPDLWFLGSMK